MLHGALDGFVLNPEATPLTVQQVSVLFALPWHVPAGGDGSLAPCCSRRGHISHSGPCGSVLLQVNLFEWCLRRSADSARKSKTCSHLYTNVHSSTSHKSQKVEKLQVSIGKWVDSVVRVTRWDRSQGLMLQLR